MFDSSALKGMKLSELQEIAKLAKTIKVNGVKKEALIEQILAHQAATMNESSGAAPKEEKPKRARIAAEGKPKIEKNTQDLFSEESVDKMQSLKEEVKIAEIKEIPQKAEKFQKKPKFIKPVKVASEEQSTEETNKEEAPKEEASENAENTSVKPQNPNQNPNQKHKNPNQNGNGNGNPNQNPNQNPNFKNKRIQTSVMPIMNLTEL